MTWGTTVRRLLAAGAVAVCIGSTVSGCSAISDLFGLNDIPTCKEYRGMDMTARLDAVENAMNAHDAGDADEGVVMFAVGNYCASPGNEDDPIDEGVRWDYVKGTGK